MLTDREIILGIVLPLVVSLIIGGIGWWTKRRWLLPLGGGVGFLLGYASSLGSAGGFGLPRIPPSDGSDWLFWMAIPAIALATLDAAIGQRRWLGIIGVALGAWSGVVTWAILHPLVPGTLSSAAAIEFAVAAAILGTAVAVISGVVAERIGHGWVVLCLAAVLGATGVTVLSSNLRTVGVYGLGAGAAVAGLVLFASRLQGARPIAILGSAILCGLLAAGHYYPDPGVTWIGVTVLALSPLLILVGLAVPTKKAWLRGMAAVLAVAIAVALVAVPVALAAMKAASENPYDNMK